MKKYGFKKGNNLVEYVIIMLFVGLVFSMLTISPQTFRNIFVNSFGNASTSGTTLTVGPIDN